MAGVAKAHQRGGLAGAPGCQADPLTKIACIEAAGGTPMIFAKPSPDELDLFTDVQRQLDAVAVLAPALVEPAGLSAWSSPIDFDAATARARGVHGFDVSPALALYAAWCLRQAGRLRHRRRSRR